MRVGHKIARYTGAVLLAMLPSAVQVQRLTATPLAALISDLSGEVSVRATAKRVAVRAERFDALSVGAIVETGRSGRAVIVLAGGQRFELHANAKATIAENNL